MTTLSSLTNTTTIGTILFVLCSGHFPTPCHSFTISFSPTRNSGLTRRKQEKAASVSSQQQQQRRRLQRRQFFLRHPLFASVSDDSGNDLFDMDSWASSEPEGMFFNEENDDNNDDDERLSDEELEATMTPWDERIPLLNTVHLVGRVGQTPEVRYLGGGKAVCNLSLAHRPRYDKYDKMYDEMQRKALNVGYGEEGPDWYRLEIWGPTAEFVSKYVDKGTRVGVIGTLELVSWRDKETNEEREEAKIVVEDFDVLETKAEAELRRSRRSQNYNNNPNKQYNQNRGGGGGGYDNNYSNRDNNRGQGNSYDNRGPSFYSSNDDDDGNDDDNNIGFFNF